VDTKTYPLAALGYRVWNIDRKVLDPINQRFPSWRSDANLAYCQRHPHLAPATGCDCGFNAYHDLTSATKKFNGPIDGFLDDDEYMIIGAVAGRGQLEIHHHGFRSEQAQVLALYVPDNYDTSCSRYQRACKKVAAKYGVPLFKDKKRLQAYLEELPVQKVPDEQRPARPEPEQRTDISIREALFGSWLLKISMMVSTVLLSTCLLLPTNQLPSIVGDNISSLLLIGMVSYLLAAAVFLVRLSKTNTR